jgi:hypothetical protein
MIQKGFCLFCGRRLDADPDRSNDGTAHDDCRRHSFPKVMKNLGTSKKELVEILNGQGILTTEKYWDCECLKNFIHPKSQGNCEICGTIAEEQPDSRISEVSAEGFLLEDDYK